MSNAGNITTPIIPEHVFDQFVNAIIDSTTIDSDGQVQISLCMSNVTALRNALGMPGNDQRLTASLIAALSERLSSGCPGGQCAGSVQQRGGL